MLSSALDDADPRVPIRAAEVLLDRGWGKPTQPIGGDREAEPIVLRISDSDAEL